MSLRRAIAGALINVGIALTALRTNLMRSILTALGVMIGVLAESCYVQHRQRCPRSRRANQRASNQ